MEFIIRDSMHTDTSTANTTSCFFTSNVLFCLFASWCVFCFLTSDVSCFLASGVVFSFIIYEMSLPSLFWNVLFFRFWHALSLSHFLYVFLLSQSCCVSQFAFLIPGVLFCFLTSVSTSDGPFAFFRRLSQTTHSLMVLRILWRATLRTTRKHVMEM